MNHTPEQFAKLPKLPKWAQEYIRNIEREKFVAVRSLNEAMNRVEPAPFYFEDSVCTGEESGPSFKRFYINTRRVCVEHAGVNLEISLPLKGDGQRLNGIELSYSAIERRLGYSAVAIMPRSISSIQLVLKENL